MHKLARLLVALVGVSATVPLHAQIANGSFETPVVPVGGFQDFSTGSTFGGWTVVGARGRVAIVSTTYTDLGLTFPAQSGAAWLDLTGNASNTATGVGQVVSTLAGTSYNLSFWVGNMWQPGGVYGTSSSVSLWINGAQMLTATNVGGVGSSTQNWMQFIFPFVAPTASTTIEFYNADGANDHSNGLDNIALTTATTSVVPEPASLVLISVGLAALVPMLRRRRRA